MCRREIFIICYNALVSIRGTRYRMEVDMKKRRLTALAMVVIMALSACSGGSQKPSQTSDAAQSITETESAAATSAEETSSPDGGAQQSEREYKLPDFKFTGDNFPRMDGSTATIPVGKMLARLLIGADEIQAEKLSKFNRTTQSFRNLKNGEADILIVGQPNAAVFTEMEEEQFKYEIEEIATDALIFVVNESNPVDNLTTEQIRDIYSGKITNWKDVGGNDEPIAAFQRNEGAGSQALMVKLIMGDTAFAPAPSGFIIGSMGELMSAVRSYDNSANAIGYSVYYYANDMKMATGLKLISVDGVKPETDTIRSGEYPHLNAYYSVIPSDPSVQTQIQKERSEAARVIYDWLAGDDGQQMLADLGYVSIKDLSAAEHAVSPKAKYTRLSQEYMGSLKARDDYGMIYPYFGESAYTDGGYASHEGTEYLGGYYCGFFDEKGRLITDPVYAAIGILKCYGTGEPGGTMLPVWYMTTVTEDPDKKTDGAEFYDYADTKYRFATMDGSFVSDEYNYIFGTSLGPMCFDDYEDPEFTLYSTNGEKLLDLQMLIDANGGESFRSRLCDYGGVTPEYGEGYYLYQLADGYWFFDEKTLRPVYGPYAYAEVFNGGVAYVREDYDEKQFVNYIERDGASLLPYGMEQAALLDGGRLMAGVESGNLHVYERESGRQVFAVDGIKYFNSQDYGVSVYPETADDNYWAFDVYDFDGKLLYSNRDRTCYLDSKLPVVTIATGQIEEKGSDGTGEDYIKIDQTGTWVKNFLTGDSAFLEDIDSIFTFSSMEQSPEVRYMSGMGTDHSSGNFEIKRSVIVDDRFNVIEDGKLYMYLDSNMMRYEHYIVTENPDKNEIVYHDADTFAPVSTWSRGGNVYGDLYIINTKTACEVYDFRSGELKLCYPRIKDLED